MIFMKLKHLFFAAFLLVLRTSSSHAQETLLIEIYGDLDKDGIAEKISVQELSEEGEDGKIRLLQIFKKINNHWKIIATSKTAILGSEGGGMMGDPFFDELISIKNGVITIEHTGGSSWKWSTTHKYRFQNKNFELIGYATHYGKLCEYWAEFDYNLSTGKIKYKKEHEICDQQTGESTITKTEKEIFVKKLKKLPNLQDINVREIKIISPKYKEELNF